MYTSDVFFFIMMGVFLKPKFFFFNTKPVFVLEMLHVVPSVPGGSAEFRTCFFLILFKTDVKKKTNVISRQTECRNCLWLNLHLRDVFQHQIMQITEGGNNLSFCAGALCSRTEPPADRTDSSLQRTLFL